MKKLACEMCGSADLLKQEGVFVCQSCGIKYSAEEVKKMMIEGTVEVAGTVKVDNTANVESMMKRGWMAMEDENHHEAYKFFENALNSNPDHAPAYVGKLCVNISKHYGWVKNDMFAYKINKEADLASYYKPLDSFPDYKKAISFADENYKAQLEGYNSEIKKRIAELGKKYALCMVIESRHDHVPGRYSNEKCHTSINGTCLVGNLRNAMVFTILRTQKRYKYDIYYYKDGSGSTPYVLNTNQSDIKEGDVAVISIEEERQRAEQERQKAEQERREQEALAKQKELERIEWERGAEQRQESRYNELVKKKNNANFSHKSYTDTEYGYQSLAKEFRSMNGYKDTAKLADECDRLGKKLQDKSIAALEWELKSPKIGLALQLAVMAGTFILAGLGDNFWEQFGGSILLVVALPATLIGIISLMFRKGIDSSGL